MTAWTKHSVLVLRHEEQRSRPSHEDVPPALCKEISSLSSATVHTVVVRLAHVRGRRLGPVVSFAVKGNARAKARPHEVGHRSPRVILPARRTLRTKRGSHALGCRGFAFCFFARAWKLPGPEPEVFRVSATTRVD